MREEGSQVEHPPEDSHMPCAKRPKHMQNGGALSSDFLPPEAEVLT